jgi:hypothetical protein
MTLWTPGGEKPVNTQAATASGSAQSGDQDMMTEEQHAEYMAQLQQQLAEAPASVVVANHCFGLFELAALHLSQPEPKLEEAQLAIDALGSIVEKLAGRLGEPEAQLIEGLTQLRLAFVQISQAADSAN